MTERRNSTAAAVWLLVLLVAGIGGYLIWRDYERHREPTPHEEMDRRLDELDEMRVRDVVLRRANGEITSDEAQRRIDEIKARGRR